MASFHKALEAARGPRPNWSEVEDSLPLQTLRPTDIANRSPSTRLLSMSTSAWCGGSTYAKGIVEWLLDKGVHPCFRPETDGLPVPFLRACEPNGLACGALGLFIDHYSEFTRTRDARLRHFKAAGTSPIHEAVASGNITAVQLVLQSKIADISTTAANGKTALHVAAETGRVNVLQYLIEHCKQSSELEAAIGCQTEQGWTPLHFAVSNGHEAAALVLLHNGADVKISDSAGRTSADFAEAGYRMASILSSPPPKGSTEALAILGPSAATTIPADVSQSAVAVATPTVSASSRIQSSSARAVALSVSVAAVAAPVPASASLSPLSDGAAGAASSSSSLPTVSPGNPDVQPAASAANSTTKPEPILVMASGVPATARLDPPALVPPEISVFGLVPSGDISDTFGMDVGVPHDAAPVPKVADAAERAISTNAAVQSVMLLTSATLEESRTASPSGLAMDWVELGATTASAPTTTVDTQRGSPPSALLQVNAAAASHLPDFALTSAGDHAQVKPAAAADLAPSVPAVSPAIPLAMLHQLSPPVEAVRATAPSASLIALERQVSELTADNEELRKRVQQISREQDGLWKKAQEAEVAHAERDAALSRAAEAERRLLEVQQQLNADVSRSALQRMDREHLQREQDLQSQLAISAGETTRKTEELLALQKSFESLNRKSEETYLSCMEELKNADTTRTLLRAEIQMRDDRLQTYEQQIQELKEAKARSHAQVQIAEWTAQQANAQNAATLVILDRVTESSRMSYVASQHAGCSPSAVEALRKQVLELESQLRSLQTASSNVHVPQDERQQATPQANASLAAIPAVEQPIMSALVADPGVILHSNTESSTSTVAHLDAHHHSIAPSASVPMVTEVVTIDTTAVDEPLPEFSASVSMVTEVVTIDTTAVDEPLPEFSASVPMVTEVVTIDTTAVDEPLPESASDGALPAPAAPATLPAPAETVSDRPSQPVEAPQLIGFDNSSIPAVSDEGTCDPVTVAAETGTTTVEARAVAAEVEASAPPSGLDAELIHLAAPSCIHDSSHSVPPMIDFSNLLPTAALDQEWTLE